MNEFFYIFKKVDGWQRLKEYKKANVLFFVLIETLLLGTSRKSLEIVRLAVQNKIYQRLLKQNKTFIKEYVEKHTESVCHKHRNTIWTIWLQGMDNAPELVKKCYKSLKTNIHDMEIVVITEDNYSQYVQFPDYIMEKYKSGIISKVHFADLLRIELLSKYGGTWLDGTVYCSGLIEGKHEFYLNSDLFLYQNLKPGLDGQASSISSWMMTSCSNNHVILLTRALLHRYWKTHNVAVDYFILHDFFQMSIDAYPEEWKMVIPISNSIPHILLLRLFEQYDEDIWNITKQITPFHKLSYKYDQKLEEKKNTYFDVILNK